MLKRVLAPILVRTSLEGNIRQIYTLIRIVMFPMARKSFISRNVIIVFYTFKQISVEIMQQQTLKRKKDFPLTLFTEYMKIKVKSLHNFDT